VFVAIRAGTFPLKASAGLGVSGAQGFSSNNRLLPAFTLATPKQPATLVFAGATEDKQATESLTRHIFGLWMVRDILRLHRNLPFCANPRGVFSAAWVSLFDLHYTTSRTPGGICRYQSKSSLIVYREFLAMGWSCAAWET
jgi:hypothetical protein